MGLDLLTVMAIGVVVFILKNVLHEAVGHGGACLLAGGRAITLSTAHFDCGSESVSSAGVRFIAAAGALANLAFGFGFRQAFRSGRFTRPDVRFFIWFAMASNFFVAAGYPLFSGISGVGDFVDVVNGFEPAWAWRLFLVAFGLVSYLLAVRVSLREMPSLVGHDDPDRLRRAVNLTVPPYLAGATLASVGAWFNPIGPFVIWTSAAASFGGSSAFAWMAQMLRTKWFPDRSDERVDLGRKPAWIVAAIVLALVHILVLGPGLDFG